MSGTSPGAGGVEHAHRHDARAVGEARDPDAVVRRLGDGRRHVRPVPVVVLGVGVVVDEVVALDEARPEQVGRAAEAPAVGVGDARVEHRDDRPAAAGPADVDEVLPRPRRVDADAREEVPLDLLPAAGRVEPARVVGDVAARAGDPRRLRALDARHAAQRGGGRLDAGAGRDRQLARARREDVGAADARGALDGGPALAVDAARVAHDDLAGPVARPVDDDTATGAAEAAGAQAAAAASAVTRASGSERRVMERRGGVRGTASAAGSCTLRTGVVRGTGTIEGWPSASSRVTSTS